MSTGNFHLTSLYNENMEVQVIVAKDEGKRISNLYMGKKWFGYTDGIETWKSFRIPWNADSEPEYVDKEIAFDLFQHVEGVGMTGWNWKFRESEWVGFDFDSIANHKAGLSENELRALESEIMKIPYATLVRSTSGKGYHLYIFFKEPVPTKTHTEHAGLARSILSLLTLETGYNFNNSVDCCGSILWVAHRKQIGTNGFSLLKRGEPLAPEKIPSNWREHINVCSKKVKKVKYNSQKFESLVSSLNSMILDEEHKRLLKWFNNKAKRDFWWDADHNMFVCHTLDLKAAHKELNLKGVFETASSGSSSQNCFAFPSYEGSWIVRRHGLAVKEHPYWVVEESGWTKCVFNALAEYESAAKGNKGIKNIKGEFVFLNHLDGLNAIKQMGLNTDFSFFENSTRRELILKEKRDSLIVKITRMPSEPCPDGFLSDSKGNYWEMCIDKPKIKREFSPPDNIVRHTISQGAESGWYININNDWVLQSKGNVTTVLLGQNDLQKSDIDIVMSKAILFPWKIVNIPFESEYPGNRTWNKDSAQKKIDPVQGDCPTWLSLLEHCGEFLNDPVKENSWCQEAGLLKGSEYLLIWFAAMFQKPLEPLPYLFFVGEQNTGKSTLHEAVGNFLLNKGYSRADNALINKGGFNSEIANSVLCVVEETDLRKNSEAANRIKDWVTGKTISINEKYKTVYDIKNSTHWIQCANDSNYCPLSSGDTRIVFCRVGKLKHEIPKSVLYEKLEKEAPAFLYLLLNIEIPEPEGRLTIPCLDTFEKKEMELSKLNDLEVFIKENCFEVLGKEIPFEVFYDRFYSWLPVDKRIVWSVNKAARSFPKTGFLCKGRKGKNNQTVLGNISFEDEKPENFYYRTNTLNGRIEKHERD